MNVAFEVDLRFLFTVIMLLIDISFFILFIGKKIWIEKEVLFFFIFIIPTINAFILGEWYLFSIYRFFMIEHILVLAVTMFFQLSIFSGLLISKNIKSKLVFSWILLIAIIFFQICTVLSILKSRKDFSAIVLEPFCYLAYVLQLFASISLISYYRKALQNVTVPKACNKCDKINDSNSKFCIYCGNRL